MATLDEPRERLASADEKVADILQRASARSFEELLGPEPEPGTEYEVDEFLGWLGEQRRATNTSMGL